MLQNNYHINFPFLFSIALNLVLLLGWLRSCEIAQQGECPPNSVVTVTDTIWVNEKKAVPVIITRVPKTQKILPAQHAPVWEGRRFMGEPSGCDTLIAAALGLCTDTVLYADTLYEPNAYRAIIADTVTGNRIIGRGFAFTALTPTVTRSTTITHTKPEKLRLYAGGFAALRFSYLLPQRVSGWSAGPALLLTIPQGVAVQYGFDARNNGHQVGIYGLLKFRK